MEGSNLAVDQVLRLSSTAELVIGKRHRQFPTKTLNKC